MKQWTLSVVQQLTGDVCPELFVWYLRENWTRSAGVTVCGGSRCVKYQEKNKQKTTELRVFRRPGAETC